MNIDNMIGIVGGVGPYTGIDLARKICDQTVATYDQDHLPLAFVSPPNKISDRSSFLLHQTDVNPAHAIFEVIRRLEQLGARVIGIPCNSSHAPPIFDVICEKMNQSRISAAIVHMIQEVAAFIHERYPNRRDIGVLCTTGSYKIQLFQKILEPKGVNVIMPSELLQESLVQKSIFDPQYGIKAQTSPVTEIARNKLREAIDYLIERGAEAIVLGCSEIPLAITEREIANTPIIDPTLVLARALIKAVDPNKLKPYNKL